MPEVAGWSLRRRLTLALMGLSAVLLAVFVIAVVLLFSVRSQQRAVINRYFTAVSLTNQRFTSQVDAETAVRGYALTQDKTTLTPGLGLRGPAYAAEVTALRQMLKGDSQTLSALDTWDAASSAWIRQWAVPTVAAIDAEGRGAVGTQEILAGKQLFDRNRAAYDGFSRQLVEKRNSASHALQLRTTLLFTAVLVLFLTLLLSGVGTWWGLRRWILRPLGALGAETRYVRSGALGHAVAVVGPREIQMLASDVDDMRQAIVEQLVLVEQASAEIEAARLVVESQAEDLVRSNRDLEQFAYVASHDLQEPLRKVASFCQLLETRYAGQLDERADQYIGFAVDGAKRMQQLIGDLLEFSRVGREERTSTVAELPLRECFDAAVDNLAVAIEQSHADVVAESLPVVSGDRVLLTQLFQNLIGNAIKFRGDDPPRVEITATDRGEVWEFACRDNGLGIEPRYAERIFVIFQRLHAKEEYSGTGIGLALCKRIVEHHGGQIWLDTNVDRGACFRWTLPQQS